MRREVFMLLPFNILVMTMQMAQTPMLKKPEAQGACWPKALPHRAALPDDCALGDLLEVLEFVQVCL